MDGPPPAGRSGPVVRLRPADPADAAAIEALRLATWRCAYRGIVSAAYLDRMAAAEAATVRRRRALLAARPDDHAEWLAEVAGRLVGWAAGGPCRDADRRGPADGEVYACYVAPPWWGRGIGDRLLRPTLERLGETGRATVSLWVLEGNERARRFYAAHGFVPDGMRQTLDLGGPVTEVRHLLW